MKKTYFTEPKNMEVVLNSHQCDYIKIKLDRFHEKILNGSQWIEYFKNYNPKALETDVFIKPVESDYYDFELKLSLRSILRKEGKL